MKTYDMIFCYQCETLVPSMQSGTVFHTGYYKVGVPAGVCKACASKETLAVRDCGQEDIYRGKKLARMA